MSTRLYSVVLQSRDPARLAGWWATTLDWWPGHVTPDEAAVLPPEGEPGVPLVVVRTDAAPSPATSRRLHLDLPSPSYERQRARVLGLVGAGADRVDVGQGAVPWEVLTDPEGTPFCVLEPRPDDGDVGGMAALVLQCADPAAAAAFWSAATGWDVVRRAPWGTGLRHPDGRGPFLELLAHEAPGADVDRLHLAVAPRPDGDRAAEVARLEALGARVLDDGAVTLLADPWGTTLRVLTPR